MFAKEPGGVLNDLQSGINKLFAQVWHSGIRTGPFDGQDWAPVVDVVEKPDRYVVAIELPGVSGNDVDVSCTPTELTVKGYKAPPADRGEQDPVAPAERNFGSFCRVLRFADPVRAEDISAELDKGVLQVVALKKVVTQATCVRIHVSETQTDSA